MIRKATIQDVKILALLNKEVQNLHHKLLPDIFKPHAQSETEKEFRKLLKNKVITAFISFDELNEANGYVLFEKKLHKNTAFCYAYESLYVQHIAVAKNSQKKGVGKELINEVILKAKSLKIDQIELDVWSLNTQAKKFFVAQGFKLFNEKMQLIPN